MTTYFPPKVNTAFITYVGLFSQADSRLMQVNPTLAAGDAKVSIDGGSFSNLATLPAVTPAGGRAVQISLSAAEMNGANIVVQLVDAAGAEWCDTLIELQTTARQIDDLAYPATSGRSMVVDAAGLVDANMVKAGPSGSGTAQTARDLGASVLLAAGQKVDVDTIKTNPVVNGGTVTFPTGATLASTTNITAGTITTASNLTTNNDKTGYALTSGERDSVADALLDRTAGIETSWTPRQGFRIMLSALAGKASGLDTGAPKYRDMADSKDRISATTDTSGNRTVVTLDNT